MRSTHCFRLSFVAVLSLAACEPSVSQTRPGPPGGLTVATPTPTPTPAASNEAVLSAPPPIAKPPPPEFPPEAFQFLLSTGGRKLIFDFETGGRSGYDPRPEWPGGSSGVTVGIGYDCGYGSRAVILSDWKALQQLSRTRLGDTAGVKGQRARAITPGLHDIFVQWEIATNVFDRVDVAREFASAKHAVPGFEDLRSNAQAAWLSLGFNRGWGMTGPNRAEMAAARALAPKRDYEGMALQFVKMKRVWRGTDIEAGMYRRRDAEARLMLSP